MKSPVSIVPFDPAHQEGVDLMMQAIQAEFSEAISPPGYNTSLTEMAKRSNEHYWVALAGDTVTGTVGIVLPGNIAVLKRMMVHPDYRGAAAGVSQALLDTAVAFARSKQAEGLYLGTMAQFKAAQRFYSRNGFRELPQSALPESFPVNPLDGMFFHIPLPLLP